MSEINMNGLFDQLNKDREDKEIQEFLIKAKQREDQWWNLYKKGLVKYDNNTTSI